MARIARTVVPGLPHHIVQRGNRRQRVFFKEKDYKDYLGLLKIYSKRFDLDILAYCLMPNHIHIIAVPARGESLARAIGETHRNYTRMINFREKWRGYLWQGRFSSYVLNERYLLAATRYILLNPVRAKMVTKAWDYEWSSARNHLNTENGSLIDGEPLNSLIDDWSTFLQSDADKNDADALIMHERTGRPLGDKSFIEKIEVTLGRSLRKKKPGPKTAIERQ